MRKATILLLTGALMAGTGTNAQTSKLDLRGRTALREAKVNGATKKGQRPAPAPITDTRHLRAFITLNEGYGTDDLACIEGLEIQGCRGRHILGEFSEERLPALEESHAVKGIQLERPVDTKMNIARALTGVDLVHQGAQLPQAYDGEGVICALVDGGFDPNHVNFVKEDGINRIENFTYFRATQNGTAATETYDASYMPNIDTESSETFHGTHSMGIMAGSYRGKVTAGVLNVNADGSATADVRETDNPYYGVAPGAGIAAAAGAGTDYYVALGIDQILNYAYWKAEDTQKTVPVVLNLSLGSNIGPHDGSSTLSKYIDAEVEMSEPQVPFIPVVSAGNEGDLPIALHKTLTDDDKELKTTLRSNDPFKTEGKYPNALYGQVYLYSDTDEPFEIQGVVINRKRGAVALRNALGATPEGASKYFCTSADYQADESDVISPQLAKNFEGYLGVTAALDTEESGRYMAIVDMMLWQTEENADGNYCIGIIAKGSAGQRIDAYCKGDWFDFSSGGIDPQEGYLDGDPDGSISDIACGRNVIAVGSYNARNYWTNIDCSIAGYDDDMFSNNKVSGFSSWGTLCDGRSLPHVCAPGATIISSSNEYYIQDNNVPESYLQATFTDGNRRHSWHQCAGTSMAAPVVAGSIALWLQADPTLTVEKVRDIIYATATADEDVSSGNPVQWGAGKFNAYEGLKEVLSRKASVEAPGADPIPELLIVRRDGTLEVSLPGAEAIEAHLYSASGAKVRYAGGRGSSAEIRTDGLDKGVYVLNVNRIHSEKIIIK
ncbi:MAG: S8 family peptidase [Muribaculaceae bacterium]|nr:S8 family peptidase [Muribaculaceae bacterium]